MRDEAKRWTSALVAIVDCSGNCVGQQQCGRRNLSQELFPISELRFKIRIAILLEIYFARSFRLRVTLVQHRTLHCDHFFLDLGFQ